jgi:hypothetical protein
LRDLHEQAQAVEAGASLHGRGPIP